MTRASLNRQINSILVAVGEANGLNMDAPISTLIATALFSVALDKIQPALVEAATAGTRAPAQAQLAPQTVAA